MKLFKERRRKMIYFDNAATTYPKPEEVYLALDKANRNAFNAGRGEYTASTEAFNMVENTRTKLAAFIKVPGKNVVFTSSATESLNLIINGVGINDGDYVYVSPFEHNAVIRPLKNLQNRVNFELIILPFDQDTWEPCLDKIEDLFTLKKPKAVFISHISNVTGYIVPFEAIFSLSSTCGAVNVLDCAQSYGVINPAIQDTNYVIFAGHKSLYASFGIAGFIKLKLDELTLTKTGGTGSDSLNSDMPFQMPYRYEAGSPNVVAITGLNSSLDWIKHTDVKKKEEDLLEYLLLRLKEINKVVLYVPGKNGNLFGIISINVEGYNPQEVASILNDEYGICVRAGYHCAPYVHDFIHSIDYNGTVRVSLGYFNSQSDIDCLVDALRSL